MFVVHFGYMVAGDLEKDNYLFFTDLSTALKEFDGFRRMYVYSMKEKNFSEECIEEMLKMSVENDRAWDLQIGLPDGYDTEEKVEKQKQRNYEYGFILSVEQVEKACGRAWE